MKAEEVIHEQADKIKALEFQLNEKKEQLKDMTTDMVFWRDKAISMKQEIEDQAKKKGVQIGDNNTQVNSF